MHELKQQTATASCQKQKTRNAKPPALRRAARARNVTISAVASPSSSGYSLDQKLDKLMRETHARDSATIPEQLARPQVVPRRAAPPEVELSAVAAALLLPSPRPPKQARVLEQWALADPMLRALSEDLREEVLDECAVRSYVPGETIIEFGERNKSGFVLICGPSSQDPFAPRSVRS